MSSPTHILKSMPPMLVFLLVASLINSTDAFSMNCGRSTPGTLILDIKTTNKYSPLQQQYFHFPQLHHKVKPLFSATSLSSSMDGQNDDRNNDNLRAKLRQLTGFSLTAIRATLRGLTGVSVTGTMKAIIGVFPTWFRYFLQPFLILYYTPLMIMKYWAVKPVEERIEDMASHQKLVESWKDAIKLAEMAQDGGYWPVHVDDDGNIVASRPPIPDSLELESINDGIVESLDVAYTLFDKEED